MRYGGALAAGGFSMAFGIATALSVLVLLCGLRWFIFVKAGQKGWKSLIPFYSDYISYKIAWDSRIFSMLVVATIAASLISLLFCWIFSVVGMILSVIILTAVLGAGAIAQMILQFKTAHAFGRSDYFAVGLFFASPVFLAILAFGDAKYQGPQMNDGIGVPQFVNQASAAASAAATAAAQQLHSNPIPPQQAPAQPMTYQQQSMQQPMQQPSPYAHYTPEGYQRPTQRRSRSGQYGE